MDKREALKEAARRLFRERGFRKTSLRDIGEAAGLTASAVSYYFGSKKGLYREVCLENGGAEDMPDVKRGIENMAVTLFAANGYEKVSIRDIAKAAHVNSAAISYYFGGKAELYKQVLYQGTNMISEFVDIMDKEKPRPEEVLLIYGQFLCRLGQERPEVLRLIFWEFMHGTKVFSEFVRQRLNQVLQILRQSVEAGIESGSFRQDLAPEAVCTAWAGMVLFFFLSQGIYEEVREEKALQPGEYLRECWKVFLRGIRR